MKLRFRLQVRLCLYDGLGEIRLKSRPSVFGGNKGSLRTSQQLLISRPIGRNVRMVLVTARRAARFGARIALRRARKTAVIVGGVDQLVWGTDGGVIGNR